MGKTEEALQLIISTNNTERHSVCVCDRKSLVKTTKMAECGLGGHMCAKFEQRQWFRCLWFCVQFDCTRGEFRGIIPKGDHAA